MQGRGYIFSSASLKMTNIPNTPNQLLMSLEASSCWIKPESKMSVFTLLILNFSLRQSITSLSPVLVPFSSHAASHAGRSAMLRGEPRQMSQTLVTPECCCTAVDRSTSLFYITLLVNLNLSSTVCNNVDTSAVSLKKKSSTQSAATSSWVSCLFSLSDAFNSRASLILPSLPRKALAESAPDAYVALERHFRIRRVIDAVLKHLILLVSVWRAKSRATESHTQTCLPAAAFDCIKTHKIGILLTY